MIFLDEYLTVLDHTGPFCTPLVQFERQKPLVCRKKEIMSNRFGIVLAIPIAITIVPKKAIAVSILLLMSA